MTGIQINATLTLVKHFMPGTRTVRRAGHGAALLEQMGG